MTKDVKFWLDRTDAGEVLLLNNDKVQKLEYEYMAKVLDQIRAEFLQTFGFEGIFEFRYEPTKTRDRYYIASGSARTTRTLNQNPGWLGKFVEQAL